MRDRWPELPLEDWKDTFTTFHLFCQVVGKVRLKHHPKINHWWHVPLYVTPRGVTIGPIPGDGKTFEKELDLAVTRFSGRRAEVAADADPVTREAYRHEVISSGFWAGDDDFPEPAFYTYVHPEPEGLADEPLRPVGAWWQPVDGGTHTALLKYHELREMEDPRQGLLDFLQSSYEAGANLAGWDREALEVR